MVKLFLKTQSFKVSVNCPKDVQQTTTTTAITNKANKQKTFVQENLLKLRKNSENLWHLDVLPIPLPTLLSLMVETLFQAGSDRIPSSCRSQSRLLVSPQEGQATSISHLPQLCVAEAKFQVSVAKKPVTNVVKMLFSNCIDVLSSNPWLDITFQTHFYIYISSISKMVIFFYSKLSVRMAIQRQMNTQLEVLYILSSAW